MKDITIGPWQISYDRQATKAAYKEIKIGGSEDCDCTHCRNFLMLRDKLYPKAAMDIFNNLGIDFKKEVEVFHLAKTQDGLHLYGGWFHFIGNIKNSSTQNNELIQYISVSENFSVCLQKKIHTPNSVFKSQPLVQIDFQVKIPWVLDEDEPI